MSAAHNDIRRIGDLSNDGVFIYNINAGKFFYVNDVFAEIFNTTAKLLVDQSKLVLPFIRTEDADYLRHRFTDLVRDHFITNAEFRLHLSDGNIRHLCCDAYMLNDTMVSGFVKDISKEKEHEDYIINYGAKKDTLLDMMTHNLSGPLYLSKHILHWIQSTYKGNTPIEISTELKMIQSNTQECIDIIDDFLKTEHMESERIYVKKTRFDVLERIAATLEKIIVTNKNKRFRLITDLKNLNISTDSVKFFQIIHNLISNSIKFTPDNGEIDIVVEEKETSFVISVRDNGIGRVDSKEDNREDNKVDAVRAADSAACLDRDKAVHKVLAREIMEMVDVVNMVMKDMETNMETRVVVTKVTATRADKATTVAAIAVTRDMVDRVMATRVAAIRVMETRVDKAIMVVIAVTRDMVIKDMVIRDMEVSKAIATRVVATRVMDMDKVVITVPSMAAVVVLVMNMIVAIMATRAIKATGEAVAVTIGTPAATRVMAAARETIATRETRATSLAIAATRVMADRVVIPVNRAMAA